MDDLAPRYKYAFWVLAGIFLVGSLVCWILYAMDNAQSAETVFINTFNKGPDADASLEPDFDRSGGTIITGLATSYDTLTLSDNVTVPEGFVYSRSSLLPVRDQGSCNSCWAFALTGVLADRIALTNDQRTRIPLSPQFMLDCSGASGGCAAGGYTTYAIDYISTFGVFPEEVSPYTGEDGTCDPQANTSYRVFIESTQHIDDITLAKKALIQFGPLYAVMALYGDNNVPELLYVKSGEVYSAVSSPTFITYHSVEIIGYYQPNADYTDAFWVVQNTWGTNWPAGASNDETRGVFMIAMGSNVAGIEDNILNINPQPFEQDAVLILDSGQAYKQKVSDENKQDERKNIYLYTAIASMIVGLSAIGMPFVGKYPQVILGVYVVILMATVIAVAVLVAQTSTNYGITDPSSGLLSVTPGSYDLNSYRTESGTVRGFSTVNGGTTVSKTDTFSTAFPVTPTMTATGTYWGGTVAVTSTPTPTGYTLDATVTSGLNIDRTFPMVNLVTHMAVAEVTPGTYAMVNSRSPYRLTSYGNGVRAMTTVGATVGGTASFYTDSTIFSVALNVDTGEWNLFEYTLSDSTATSSGSVGLLYAGAEGDSMRVTNMYQNTYPMWVARTSATEVKFLRITDTTWPSTVASPVSVTLGALAAAYTYVYYRSDGDIEIGSWKGFYARSSDGGATFGLTAQYASISASNLGHCVRMTTNGLMLGHDGSNHAIYNTATDSKVGTISGFYGQLSEPNVDIGRFDDGTLMLVGVGSDQLTIKYATSTDDGVTWSALTTLLTDTTNWSSPAVDIELVISSDGRPIVFLSQQNTRSTMFIGDTTGTFKSDVVFAWTAIGIEA